MTQAIAAFRDVRVAAEDTTGNGTKEDTAVQRLHGMLSCPMGAPILHRPAESYAALDGARRTVVVGNEPIPLRFEGDCTFEQMIYILQSVAALNAGTQINDHYFWQFFPNMGEYAAPKSLTFQFGDNLEQFDVEYCIARSIEISGVMNEAMKVSAEYFGRHFETTNWDPDPLASPTVLESCLTNKTKLYIDPVTGGGGMGGTEIAATLLDFTVRIDPGHRPLKYGSALAYFDAISQVPWSFEIDMTVLWNSAMLAQAVFYRAGTPRYFALKTTGTASRALEFYCPGIYTKFDTIEERDGMAVVSITIKSQYDVNWATGFMIRVSNLLANLDTVNP